MALKILKFIKIIIFFMKTKLLTKYNIKNDRRIFLE